MSSLVTCLVPCAWFVGTMISALQRVEEPTLRIEFGKAEFSPADERGVLQMYEEPVYLEILDAISKHFGDRVRRLGKKPVGASERTLYGINLQLDGITVPWAFLPADAEKGTKPQMWIDFDADGDLDDEAPLTFEEKAGKPQTAFAKTMKGKVGDEIVEFDCPMELTLDSIELPGSPEPTQVILLRDKLVRRGSVLVPGRKEPLDVALVAIAGMFDNDYSEVFFDLDGDHRFAFGDDRSPERVRVDERGVRLFDKSYAFEIDRYGRFMDLVPSTENIAQRALIEIGEPVPAIESVDLDGNPVKLSEYAGKYVLLDFWSVGCGPCVAELPKLVEAYAKYHDKGFEILGIVGDGADPDRLAALRKLLTAKKVPWKQIPQEDTKGPIMRQFRVSAFPTCYLVDRDGTFLLLDARPEKLIPYLENLFRSEG